ncbi:MAG: DUF4167 domain-containing protein [Alphaproteobacteria bacterium]|nr:DUF4167 domain-containing protein [Alphaproteobacteria bacterium]
MKHGHGSNHRRGGRNRNNNGRRFSNPNFRHNNFESTGPEVKIRGTAQQVLEKYLALARDAASAGDRIAAENFLQHAEHYYRIVTLNNPGQGQQQGNGGQRPQQGAPQPSPAGHDDGHGGEMGDEGDDFGPEGAEAQPPAPSDDGGQPRG